MMPQTPFNHATLSSDEAPQTVFLLDITGTLTDDESHMRAIWEDLCTRMGVETAVDWDSWHGIGNEAIFDDLVKRNFINENNVRTILKDLIRDPGYMAKNPETEMLMASVNDPLVSGSRFKILQHVLENHFNAMYNQIVMTKNSLLFRPGIPEILKHCADNSIPVVLVTNDPERVLEQKMYVLKLFKQRGIYDRVGNFPFIIGPEQAGGKKKPDPAIHAEAHRCLQEEFPEKPLRYVTMEDSEAGLVAARHFAMQLYGTPHQFEHFIQYKFLLDSPESRYATVHATDKDVVQKFKAAVENIASREAIPGHPKPAPADVADAMLFVSRPSP